MEKTQKRKMSLKSIKGRIISLVILGSLYIAVVLSFILSRQSNKFVENAYGSILRQTTMGYVNLLSDEIGRSTDDTLTPEQFSKTFEDIMIEGINQVNYVIIGENYKYLMQSNTGNIGTDASMISEIKDTVDQINAERSGNYIIKSLYDVDGEKNIACFTNLNGSNSILVLYFSNEVIKKQVKNTLISASGTALGSITILLILGNILANSILKPIRAISENISSFSKLDFTNSADIEKLEKRKDETGEMARAIKTMQSNLQTVIEHILKVSAELQDNSRNLHDVSLQINNASTDNSATAEELAASMEETAATVETIDANTIQIKENANNIGKRAMGGVSMASEISQRARNLYTSSVKSSQETEQIYALVREKTEEAIKQSKAVEKVNALATTIQDIADQTSLLSLNASIEAARAGELGKGFAVVAGEIGHLAAESTATVKGIMSIVDEVNEAVRNMGECMTTTLEFLDTKVMKDYKTFVEVSNQYDSDAQSVSTSMDMIYQLVASLQAASEEISVSISGISTTVGEAAQGVNDVAEKTSEVVELSNNVVSVVENTSHCSKYLQKIADAFKI